MRFSCPQCGSDRFTSTFKDGVLDKGHCKGCKYVWDRALDDHKVFNYVVNEFYLTEERAVAIAQKVGAAYGPTTDNFCFLNRKQLLEFVKELVVDIDEQIT